ncbi:LysR substrate-binding domain-containing protein [Novispirillum itersonii subsp. nipponicum]
METLMRPLPTLRQLRYLVTVAETLHFGKAAEKCFVTQSTLSAGIQDLEDLLGVTLIERQSRRKVVITPLGDDIIQRARKLLTDAEALSDAARAGADPLAGDLRLGVIPTIGPYVLPGVMPAARRAYPDLRLFLREEQSARLLSDLDAGRVDAGLLALPYETGDLVVHPLWREDVVALLPQGHPLADQPRLYDRDLLGVDLLMLEDGHCLRDHALQACGLRGPRENEAFQATSVRTLVQMVANGLGVTLLPRSALPVEISDGAPVVIRPLDGAVPARTIALVWRRASPRGRDFRLLGDLLIANAPAGMLPL